MKQGKKDRQEKMAVKNLAQKEKRAKKKELKLEKRVKKKGKKRQKQILKKDGKLARMLRRMKEYRERKKNSNADVNQAEDEMICCENLVKIYKTDEVEVMALQGLDLVVKRGELMAIIGNSGSGKSTLLNMIGGLAKPSAGKLYVGGKDLFRMSERELVDYKKNTVGFVWQNNARNLFPYLTAQQNVEVPLLLQEKQRKRGKHASNEKKEQAATIDTEKRALELLQLVGMEHKKNNRLSELSGGEQQRIAIAIALSNNPDLLLADEPTGAVDMRTAAMILDLFQKLNTELGLTIVIVTHDPNLANKVSRVVRIRDGKISSEQLMKESIKQQLLEAKTFSDEEIKKQLSDITLSHEEFAVLDRNGRIQLNEDMLKELHLSGNNLKVEMVDGRIVISNPMGG